MAGQQNMNMITGAELKKLVLKMLVQAKRRKKTYYQPIIKEALRPLVTTDTKVDKIISCLLEGRTPLANDDEDTDDPDASFKQRLAPFVTKLKNDYRFLFLSVPSNERPSQQSSDGMKTQEELEKKKMRRSKKLDLETQRHGYHSDNFILHLCMDEKKLQSIILNDPGCVNKVAVTTISELHNAIDTFITTTAAESCLAIIVVLGHGGLRGLRLDSNGQNERENLDNIVAFVKNSWNLKLKESKENLAARPVKLILLFTQCYGHLFTPCDTDNFCADSLTTEDDKITWCDPLDSDLEKEYNTDPESLTFGQFQRVKTYKPTVCLIELDDWAQKLSEQIQLEVYGKTLYECSDSMSASDGDLDELEVFVMENVSDENKKNESFSAMSDVPVQEGNVKPDEDDSLMKRIL